MSTENIRNIGNADGELAAHFATPENLVSTQRNVERELREAILDVYDGLLSRFSDMFSGANFSTQHLDVTGVSPKLTFCANCEYTAHATDAGDSKVIDHTFNKRVFLSASVPSALKINLVDGLPPAYGSPAINEADFALRGGFNDRAGQRDFMNRYSLSHGTYLTAAACQMAYFYMTYFMLPRLNGNDTGFVLAAVEEVGRYDNPTPVQTAMMPSELTAHHNSAVLSVIHAALQANNILTPLGYDPAESRVFNKSGYLPQADIDEATFCEAWHVLKHSAIGSSRSEQWDMDFLLLVIQNFPLHGISDEGGVWRKLFDNLYVRPNFCVITSNFRANTVGFHNFNDRMVLGSAITIQSLISRAIFECDYSNTKFMLAPNPEPGDVNDVVQMMRGHIVSAMVSSTSLPTDYWEDVLKVLHPNTFAHDRHLVENFALFLRNFSPFMMTYSLDVVGDKLGRYEYEPGSNQPLKFHGEYETKIVSQDNSFYFAYDMQNDMTFKDGLLYINPKVNTDDGIMDLTHCGAFTGDNRPLADTIELVDGRTFNYGDTVGSVLWADNNDVIPTTGDFMSVRATTVLLSTDYTGSWITRGKYTVKLSRYAPCRKQKGEGRKAGHSRIDCINTKMGRVYTDYAKKRPDITDTRQYFRRWKGLTATSSRRKTERLLRKNNRMKKEFCEMFSLNEETMDVETVADILTKQIRSEAEKLSSLQIMVSKCLRSGEYSVTAEDVANWKAVKGGSGIDSDFYLLTPVQVKNAKRETSDKALPSIRYGALTHERIFNEDTAVSEMQGFQSALVAMADHIRSHILTTTGSVLGRDRMDTIVHTFDHVMSKVNEEYEGVTESIKYSRVSSRAKIIPTTGIFNLSAANVFPDTGHSMPLRLGSLASSTTPVSSSTTPRGASTLSSEDQIRVRDIIYERLGNTTPDQRSLTLREWVDTLRMSDFDRDTRAVLTSLAADEGSTIETIGQTYEGMRALIEEPKVQDADTEGPHLSDIDENSPSTTQTSQAVTTTSVTDPAITTTRTQTSSVGESKEENSPDDAE